MTRQDADALITGAARRQLVDAPEQAFRRWWRAYRQDHPRSILTASMRTTARSAFMEGYLFALKDVQTVLEQQSEEPPPPSVPRS